MQDYLKIILVLLVAGVLYYLVFSYYQKKNNVDRFSNYGPVSNARGCYSNIDEKKYLGCAGNQNFTAYDPEGTNQHQVVHSKQEEKAEVPNSKMPKDCFPKDQLNPSELLPSNANSQWAQVNPSGKGKLGDQNFLSAGYHIGVNTVGQSLRNPNLQLRSEPANPQTKVSPWMQTTIEPDINRRPLEIGGC